MGSCGAKERVYDSNDLVNLIKVQNLWRRKKAMQKLNANRKKQMKTLFSKLSSLISYNSISK
jgi:hypothetical protein